MNYLHVISSLNPVGGGPAEGVKQLCATARRMGHGCEIATLDAPGEPWADSVACPVHPLGPGRLGRYRYAPGVQHWLRSNAARFEAVIVNGLWQYHGVAVRQALLRTGTPYFVFTHGMLDPWFKRRYPLKHLKKWMYWPLGEYRVLRDARAVLFTSEEERREARKSFGLYRVNEAVVNYGTPGPRGDGPVQREMFLRRFPELNDKRLLLFLGRIHPKKGCDLLLEAFAGIAHRHPSAQLVMAGPDSVNWQAELVRRAQRAGLGSRITWTGMLAGDLKWGAFRASEAFILPSHQENFGIAVAEALACGLPVLISDKVNIWREIEQDGAGIVAKDTLDGTSQLLRTWAEMSSCELERMGQNAIHSFRGRFHIEMAASGLLTTMEGCIRASPS